MSENTVKCPSHIPKAKVEVFKLPSPKPRDIQFA